VPTDYDPRHAYSLIFVFHGAGGSSASSHALGLQEVPGAAQEGIFVFPQGIPFEKDGVGWDETNRGYDLPFFDNMVSALESSYCIDTGEVFASGFSWGGDFATALACNRGDTLRAIAVNSSTDEYSDNTNYLTFKGLPCPSHLHPAVRFEHAAIADKAYPAPDFATTSKLFQFFNQCSGPSKPVASRSSVMLCQQFDHCTQPYVECAFDSSIGHALPPHWAKDTWAFFLKFREPAGISSEVGGK
jgi:poly(3-hydroxybutyrate) depolymerase